MTLLCLLSPAKRMEYRRPLPFACATSRPKFEKEALRIAQALKRLKGEQLQSLMGISEKLAARTHAQYQAFSETGDNSSRAALYAFHGDTYIGLNAYALSETSVAQAQKRLRILSGLYGMLRPLDAIQPYRCEMGLRLARQDGEKALQEAFEAAPTPAHWWRARVRQALLEVIEATGARWLVNLASKEYSSAVEDSPVPLVEVVFAEERGGAVRRLGMAEKRMRGACAKYIVENDIRTIEQLKAFGESIDACGYRFASSANDSVLRFVKPSPSPSPSASTPLC